eukprot:13222316-Ditylum_brightwellii.AAC.1
MIVEQLINGTPPCAANDNIIAITLAAHQLGKANKFGQLNTDGTGRRQLYFQNLVISVEEDELF